MDGQIKSAGGCMQCKIMELLRPAVLWVLCQSGSPLVGGMVALRAPRQPARGFPWVEGTRILLRRQHPGGPTRLGWRSQVHDTFGGEVPTVLPAAALGHG